MSTYRRYLNDLSISIPNAPEFLNHYLQYSCVFNMRQATTVNENGMILREFFQYTLFRRHNGPRSVVDKYTFRDFSIVTATLADACTVSSQEVATYMQYLDNVAGNAAATRRKKLNVIRNFYTYVISHAAELGVAGPATNPAGKLKISSKKEGGTAKILSKSQISRLLDAVSGENALRDKCMILLISTTAMTLSEIAALNREDVDLDAKEIRIKAASLERIAYLTDACAAMLRRYINSAEILSDAAIYPLFVASDSARRLTPRAIQVRITRAANDAGLASMDISARDLRDTAIAMLIHGKSAPEQAEIFYSLGYRSLNVMSRFPGAAKPIADSAQLLKAATESSPLSSIGLSDANM